MSSTRTKVVLPWVIEETSDGQAEQLTRYLQSIAHPYSLVPWGQAASHTNDYAKYCFIGSIKSATLLRDDILPSFTPSKYRYSEMDSIRPFLFNSDFKIYSASDITPNNIDTLYDLDDSEFGDDTLFVRPNSGLHPFNSEPRTAQQLLNLVSTLDAEDKIILASVKEAPVEEYRVCMSYDHPITTSRYKTYGKPLTSFIIKDVMGYAAHQTQNLNFIPDPLFYIDIAVDQYQRMSILEYSALSCAGIYDCDVKIIVDTINSLVSTNKLQNV